MTRRRTGEVTGVHAHHDGKHVEVRVAHGKKKTPPKGKKGQPAPYDFDDRPSSTVMVPKDEAENYGVGKKVGVSLDSPTDGDEDDLDDLIRKTKRGRSHT